MTGYEEAREELADVVRRLEAGGTTLEEALGLWERGEELVRICTEWLDAAQHRLDSAGRQAADQPAGDGDAVAADPEADGAGGD